MKEELKFELVWDKVTGVHFVCGTFPEICPAMMGVGGIEYRLIGYQYAESDVITTFGPNAFWQKMGWGKDHCPLSIRRLGTGDYPIFATHVVYQLVQEVSNDHN